MQNWNDEVQMITAEHRRRKCYSVIAIVLAIVVALSVFGSLILPAISMTWNSTWTSDTTGSVVSTEDILNDDGDTTQNLTAPLHNSAVQSLSVYSDIDIDMTSYVTDVSSAYTGEVIYADSATVSFTLTYSGLPLTSTTICYELPEGLTPVSGKSSSGSTTTSSYAWFSYSGTRVTGTYNIVQNDDTDKYYIVVTFTDEYYAWVQSNTTGTISGGIEFDGSVAREKTASGDRTLSFQTNNGNKDITFNFSDADLTMKKEATSVTGNDGNVTITWTITITNSGGLWNLEGKTLTDVLSDVSGVTATVDPTSISVSPSSAASYDSNGNFTFSNTDDIETITIQYDTTVTGSFNGEQLITNTATLQYGDDDDHTVSSSASVTLKEISISKSGQTDYSVSSDSIEGNIDWTITVQDQYGAALAGAVITDDLFASAIDSSISVKDESGNNVAFTYDATNHTITIDSSATAKKVIITYSTKAVNIEQGDAQATVQNTAKVKKDSIEDSASASVTYNESEIYTLSKSGVYDNDAKQLTWSITISTGNNNNHTLDGYQITDTKFSGMDTSNIEVYAATSQWSGRADASASVSISGDTLTISTSNAKYIVLTYTETIDDFSEYGDGTYTFTNTVSDKFGDTATAEFGYTPRNEFIKSSSVESVTEIGTGSSDLTVDWTIYWTNDKGFNNETIYDKLDDGLTLVKDSIKVEVSTDGIEWNKLIQNVNYTLTASSSDYTFSLSGISSEYHYLRVTYQTTSDLSEETFEEGDSSYEKRFTNKAWYQGMTGDYVQNGFDYTLRNPNEVSTLDITINKTWDTSKGYDGNIVTATTDSTGTITYNCPEVSFYILRRDVNSYEWVYLKQDGNTYVEVHDKSEATQFTTSSLTTTITGLPAEAFYQDETTGEYTSITYVYKVEEVDAVGSCTISDYYDTSYSNNNIVSSGTVDVTNSYRAFYYKTAIDSNGNEISTINMADLPTIVEGGETYYIVNWKIVCYDGIRTSINEILPDHFELVYTGETADGKWNDAYSLSDPYTGIGTTGVSNSNGIGFGEEDKVYKYVINPYYGYHDSGGYFIGYQHLFTVDESTVLFLEDNSGSYDIYFSTKISEEDLYAYYTDESSFDEDGNLIGNIVLYNTATADGGVSDTAKLKITPKEPVVSEGEYISKYFEPNVKYTDADRYDIYYALDINPEGYTLSSSGTIDVTDTLTKIVDEDGNPLSVLLQSIDVYTVDGDGNKTLLDAGSYSYNVEYNLEDLSRPDPTVISNSEIQSHEAYNINTNGTSISCSYTNVESVTFRLNSSFSETSEWFAFKLNQDDALYRNLSVTSGIATVPSSYKLSFCQHYAITTNENSTSDVTIYTAEAGYTTINSIATEKDSLSASVDSITINYLSESGGTTPAQITFTLPDATHIYIGYHYELIDVDNVSVNMTNVATVSTNQVEESVECDNNNIWIAHSSAYVEADGFPVLYKTNVAATSTHLATDFYLLKYDNGNWLYATGIAASQDSSGNEVTDSSGNPIYTCSSWTELKDSADCITMTSNGFRFNSFESGGLYCFMEVSTATDPNDSTAIYATISGEDPYYYYFTYCGSASDYSDVTGVNGETITIDTTSLATTNGGAVNVPNNKLITIQAQKLWDNSSTWLSGASVELTLMSSSTRSITGVPSDAVVVEADTTNENPQTLSSADSTAEWTILPNGSDGKPIYYYVVETAYTVNSTTYTLAEDGKYYDADGNEGDYTASYSSMAIVDNAVFDTEAGTSGVTVNNSSGLTVAKRWTDVDNKTTSAYLDYISFILYGTTEDGTEEKIGTGTLNDSNNWMIHIGSSSDSSFTFESGKSADNLGSYTSFRVEEVQEYTDENEVTSYPLYGYTISYILQVTDGQGVITIVNKNNTQTTCSVSVEKVWGSGTSGLETPIQVTLYQGTSNNYSVNDIANMSEDERKEAGFTTVIYEYDLSDEESTESVAVNNPVILGGTSLEDTYNDSALKYAWSNLPYTNEDGARYYYYVVETVPDGVDWSSSYTTVSGANPKYTITNRVPGVLEVEKKWVAGSTELSDEEASNYTATFAIYRNRTSCDPEMTNVLQQLSAVNGGTGSIVVDAIGDSITAGSFNGISETYRYPTQLQSMLTSYGYSSVTVNNRGTDGAETSAIESQVLGITADTDVVCIISGTNDVIDATELTGTTNDSSVVLSGVSMIESLIKAVYNKAADVGNNKIVVLIGSIPYFDFIDSDGNCRETATWPHFLKETKYSDLYKYDVTSAQLIEDIMNNSVDNFNADIQTAVAELQATYPTLQFVDVCSAIDKDTMLYDGVHPNEAGYEALATAFYQAIIDETPDTETDESTDTSESGGSSTVVNNGMPSDFYTYDEDGNVTGINLEDYIQVEITKENVKSANVEIDTDGTFELNSSNNWSASFTGLPTADDNGTKYKYYVVEVDGHKTQTLSTQTIANGWTVSYDGEGVTVDSDGTVSGSITITNTLEVVELSIEKFWNDLGAETANDHTGSTVTVTLYRTTNPLSDAQPSRLILEDEYGNEISDEGITLSTSGSGTTIYTTTPISSITCASDDVEISYEYGLCSFSIRVADGVDATEGDISTTITVTDTNGISQVLKITITNLALLMLSVSDSSLSLIAGIDQTVTASVSSGNITSLIVPDGSFYDVEISGNTFTIIGKATGTETITIQALCDGNDGCGEGKYHEATLTIQVNLPDEFTIEGGDSVDIDDTLQLTPNPNYGTFTWSSSDTSVATVDANGLVTGVSAGSATITAMREDGITATITITVNEAATQKTLTNVTDSLEIDTSRPVDYIEFEISENSGSWAEGYLNITTTSNSSQQFKVGFYGLNKDGSGLVIESLDGIERSEYSENGYTLTTNLATPTATLTVQIGGVYLSQVYWTSCSFTSISYTVHYASGASPTSLTPYASTTATYATDYSQYGEEIGTYVISGNDGSDWTLQLSDLLKYDPDGNPYYYYVVETDVSGYTATYWYGGETCINAASCSSDSPGEIQIENVRTESTNISLPSTGGDGTSGFVAAGIACITTASIGTILNLTWRRKRQHNGVTRHGKE